MNNKKNKLSQKDIEHVATLARIEISQTEKKIYSDQLSSILEYIDKLNEVDTENIAPATHISDLSNVMRTDVDKKCNTQEDLIEVAPESEKNMVKVKAVLKGGN